MNEKTMKILGGIIGGFVIFIVILFLISSCTKEKYTYEKLESKMLKVAQNYYKNNSDKLPSEDKGTKMYSLIDMIHDGKIKKVSEMFGDDAKCEGNVTVTNNGGYYNYSVYLDCGEDYKTKYLYEKIIDDNLVTADVGLYEVGNEYIMKGEVKNNYVKYDNRLFRIMRINEDKSIRLIEDEGLTSVLWDDRYNETEKFKTGINEYILNNQISSRLKEALDNYYENEKVWPKEFKAYIPTQTLCIGKRAKADQTKDGSTECSQKLENQNLGALALYEYLQASLDNSCSGTIDKNCGNYNWISNYNRSIWTITASSERSDNAYSIHRTPTSSSCSNKIYANAVFNLTSKTVYVDGDGSKDKPYTFK